MSNKILEPRETLQRVVEDNPKVFAHRIKSKYRTSVWLLQIPSSLATQSLLPASSPFLLFGSAEEASCKSILELPVSICELQSLETLYLGGCRNLKVLPEDFNSLISLRWLSITTTAMNLPRMECLTSLRLLSIVLSPNLISLPINPTLEILIIGHCEMFTLTENKDNDQVGKLSLRKLILIVLPKMTAFPRWLQGCEDTLNLLSIVGCPNFTALPDWLPNMASLEKLLIDECSELQSLPAERMHLLTSLQRLKIVECPELRNSVKVMSKDWLHNIDFEHDYDFEDEEEVEHDLVADPSVSEH